MTSQYNLVHTAAPSINAQCTHANKFVQRADLCASAQRSIVLDGRNMWADELISDFNSNLYRCSGGSLDAKANGCLKKVTNRCSALIRVRIQSVTVEWGVTNAGSTKTSSMRALLPEAAKIVKNSRTITAPALGSMLKAPMDCGDIAGRTLNRHNMVLIRNERSQDKSETYRSLMDYREQLKEVSGGCINWHTAARFQCDLNVLGYST